MAEATSTKPYLLRAIYEWCVDNGFTPYVLVRVDSRVSVPMEYVRDGEIVLNIGPLASHRLRIGNDQLECAARFGGIARDIFVPIDAIRHIYARENGQGLAFPEEPQRVLEGSQESQGSGGDEEPPEPIRPGGRPALRRVK